MLAKDSGVSSAIGIGMLVSVAMGRPMGVTAVVSGGLAAGSMADMIAAEVKGGNRLSPAVFSSLVAAR
ncbi:hypothetical protein [Streptomyces xylophagus]|uniref:hypothetical protein n=1 Tax=Streptomyces xylophagus TaxID=285514 RepID=UPI0005BB81BB|nr:hypothetical protein [Streptomyces xylophagus]